MIIKFFNSINSFLLIGIFTLVAPQINGQTLSGTKTVCSSGCDYPTVSSAVNALNTNGVGTGGVTINILAGHTETLTSGIVLSVSGTATSPIVFQRSGTGNNPLLTSFSGNKLANSTDSIDIMWSFEGSDYVTINGIDFQENVLNTTPTLMMEVGIGFYKKSGIDGASHNEIKNCVITLNRNNVTLSSGVRSNASGAVGIEFVNATRTNLGTSIAVSSVSGASSFNKIYGNTIQNCNFGISLIGYAAPSPYTFADVNNEIGGETSLTGNTIINFGGGAGANMACGAMFIHNQWGFVIANNTVNNNTGVGQNHPSSNRGIWVFASSAGSSCDIIKNRITISGGNVTNWCLSFEGAASGANGNTINIDSNQFLNCNVTSTSTQSFCAIWLSTVATNVNVRNNYIYGFRYSGNGTSRVIFSGLACGNLNISNNEIDSVVLDGTSANGTHDNIGVTVAPLTTLSISYNDISRTMLSTLGAGGKTITGIYFYAALVTHCKGNIIDGVLRNGTSGGTSIGIYQLGGNNGISNVIISKNIISNHHITGTGGNSIISGIQTSEGIIVVDSNSIFNLSCQKPIGNGSLIGITNKASSTNETYRNNNIYNLNNAGTGVTYGINLSAVIFEGRRDISNNQIYAFNTAGLTIAGIAIEGTQTSVFNNRVYDISSSSIGNAKVSGVLVLPSSGTIHIYNNLVGDLRATSAITTSPLTSPTIVGVNVPSTTGGTIDVSHNTVFINATSTGTVFGTAALFHSDNSSLMISKLRLRNNILVNTSTAMGAGKTVAYHRSGITMGNFDSASNGNLYYAGVPSVNNFIFYDGTNADQTLSSYQARAIPRDSVSYTENVSFVNTSGSNASFLKINPTIPTSVEASSTFGTGISFDFNNTIRAGFPGYTGMSGTPDLGAWEDNLIPLPTNNMYLDSLNAEHMATLAPRGTTNNVIFRIPVHTCKGANALVATSFKLNTTGTTSITDILDAKIFYTGLNSSFSDSNLFGSLNNPSGSFNISGNQNLITGVNYFWLTYTISATAIPSNLLDAILDSITLSGLQYAPINGNPNGAVTIQTRLSGDYNVGIAQTFTSITQALIALKQLGVSGPIKFILKDTIYNQGTGESFPILLSPYTNASSVNTVTLVPDSGVNVSIIGNSGVATIDFNNCSHFFIDGRQGGKGAPFSGTNMIIRTTRTNSPAIRFINDADSNQILHADIRASNTASVELNRSGVVRFSTTTLLTGNDFNTIKFCEIRDDEFLGTPSTAIASIGSGHTPEAGNDNNIIDSCRIYNYFRPSSHSTAIYIGDNNSTWKIRGNKFYQTALRTYLSGFWVHRVLWISPTNQNNSSGFEIYNNYIGGNNENGTGKYEVESNFTNFFQPMHIFVGYNTPTSIQGNSITNISYKTSNTTTEAFIGMNITGGNLNVGTIQGNTIGSRTNDGAITAVFNSLEKCGFTGIRVLGSQGGTINIVNNNISGCNIYGTTTTTTPDFYGIHLVNGANVNIINNTIGDTTPLSAKIGVFSSATSGTTTQRVAGILINILSSKPVCDVSNNLISNIFNFHSVNGSHETSTKGIFFYTTNDGDFNINNNIVTNLYSAAKTTASGFYSAVGGIAAFGSFGTFNMKQNTISGLHLTAPLSTQAVRNTGIHFSTPSSSTNHLIRNFVHTQMIWGNNPTAIITGIEIANGNNNVNNNIVRMGIDSSGLPYTGGSTFVGISKNSGNSKVYFNTVYIGGNNVYNTSNNTSAFMRNGLGSDTLLNNIFINVRSNNTSGGPGHFAIQLNNNTTLKSDYNLLFADTIGRVGNTVLKSLFNWRDGASNDTNSIYGNAGFINPNGGINTVDLRINSLTPTPIEGMGTEVTGEGADVDFDGQLRTANTPVDIGADAGVFSLLDLVPPTIKLAALQNTSSLTDRVVTATIIDKSGIYTTGILRPRVYFKKSSSGVFHSTPGLLNSGNGLNGSWTFTINNALLGGVIGNDTIFYFVVAQDSITVSNIGSNSDGIAGTNVNNITTYPTLSFYKVFNIVSGTFNVGQGQTFTTLTGINGMFDYISSGILTGDVTINITSSINEPGIFDLLGTTENGIGNYTIRIQPSAPTLYSIKGDVDNNGSGLIRLTGAKNIVIDGSYAGNGRYLSFLNRREFGATILFQDDARRDTIRNCIIEGVNTTTGVIYFGPSRIIGGVGNDSNAIIGCVIRDTVGTNVFGNGPVVCIRSDFGMNGIKNDRIAILDNEFMNFSANAINLKSIATGNFWLINNNKFYRTNTGITSHIRVILIEGGTGHSISNNSIGGSNVNRGSRAFNSTSFVSHFTASD